MSITRNTNTIYFEDLIKYSLDLIGQKCRNVYRNSQSETRLPTESEFDNGNEYVFSYGNPSKMYVTPRCNSYAKVQLGEFFGPTSTTSISVAYQLRIFLQQRGVLSKAKSVMTTKSILNYFSQLSIFINYKVKTLTTYDNSSKYVLYDYYSNNVPTEEFSDDQNNITIEDETKYIDNLLSCIADKTNINSNSLIVRYVSSSSSSSSSCSCSSSSSCSCSSSSCSSSSSSFIVYMLIK